MTQQLFLNLSMRSIPSPDVLAVNMDGYSITLLCAAVVVFLNSGECLYLSVHSQDAQSIADWANTQPGEQFLCLPPSHCFNVAHIKATAIGDKEIVVTMDSIELPFHVPATRSAESALLAWAGEEDDEPTTKRAVVLA